MEFWVAVLLFLLAVAGIVLSAVCLRRKKVLRVVCIVICSLLAAALAACVGSFRIHPKETGLFNSPRPEHSERGLLLSAAH